jgi:hypothetical protein
MQTLAAAFVVFLAVVLAMAIGAVVQGRRLKGSCGGANGACTCSALAARTCPRRRASG